MAALKSLWVSQAANISTVTGGFVDVPITDQSPVRDPMSKERVIGLEVLKE